MPRPQLTPPRGAVRQFHGVESLNDAVRGGDLDHVQLARGAFTGTLGYMNLGVGVVGFGETDTAVRTRGCFSPAGHALGVLLEMPRSGRFWGAAGAAGSVLVSPLRAEADATVFGPHRYAYLILPPASWDGTVAALAPRAAETLLRGPGVFHPPPALARRLIGRLTALIRLISAGRWLTATAAVAAGEEILGLMTRAVADGEESVEPCGRFFRHRRIVARAEEHLRGRLGQDVYTRELCQLCDVSERTLEYAFREILGLSPMAYLRRRRLVAVRCELAADSPDPPTVAQAAMRCGFWHLGEFATAYKSLFGESPGETVRSPHRQKA